MLKLIVHYASAEQGCPHLSFLCDNGRCIDDAIRCNGYDSCGDNSGCRQDISSGTIAGIVVGSLVGFFVLIGILIAVTCNISKRRKLEKVIIIDLVSKRMLKLLLNVLTLH